MAASHVRPSRRALLQLLGGSAGLLLLEGLEACCTPPHFPNPIDLEIYEELFLRREDMVCLSIRLVGFRRYGRRLRRIIDHPHAFLIVGFPPQCVAEQTFLDPAPIAIAHALLAAPSQIAFRIPDEITELPHDIETLLGWRLGHRLFELQTAEIAVGSAYKPVRPDPTNITDPITFFDIPGHMYLTPVAGHWSNARRPVRGYSGFSELWTTRLVPDLTKEKAAVDAGKPVTLRHGTVEGMAMWTDDYDSPDASAVEPYSTALTPAFGGGDAKTVASNTLAIRKELVDLSCNVDGKHPNQPLLLDNITLSAMGGWANVRGAWDTQDLTAWRHIVSQGRDQFAQLFERSYLFPFGHEASLIATTNRSFDISGRLLTAALHTLQFIELKKQELRYNGTFDLPYTRLRVALGRTPPLQYWMRVDLRTGLADPATQLPLLDPRTQAPFNLQHLSQLSIKPPDAGKLIDPQIFVPCLQPGVPYEFPLQGVDRSDATQSFTAPVLVLRGPANYALGPKGGLQPDERAKVMEDLNAVYEALLLRLGTYKETLQEAGHNRGACDLRGSRVSFADLGPLAASGAAAEATLTTRSLLFSATPVDLPDPSEFNRSFGPRVARAVVSQPALAHLIGQTGDDGMYGIRYLPQYASRGFTVSTDVHAKLGVFATLESPSAINFAPSDGRGVSLQLVTPNMSLRSLSATHGLLPVDFTSPLGDVPLDPATLFGPITGMSLGNIVGGIPLKDILNSIALPEIGKVSADLPALTHTVRDGILTAHYKWCTDNLKDGNPLFLPRPGARLCIDANLTAGLDGRHMDVACTLSNFSLRFFGAAPFLAIHFDHVTVHKQDDQPPNVEVKINSFEFGAALKLLDAVIAFATRLFSGGSLPLPRITIAAGAINVDHRFALPSPIPAGVFNIQHIAFVVGLTIPLNGRPVGLRFGFAERDNPFLLTVLLLGGGGYFTVNAEPRLPSDPDFPFHITKVEGALEWGGAVALNFGVASGEVHALAGVYFSYEGTGLTIESHLRCGGSLSILGLITLTVEFYVGLGFTNQTDGAQHGPRLFGTASLTVSIEIMFFSASVTLSITRCFALSDAATCGANDLSDDGPKLAASDLRSYLAAFV